MKDIIYLEKTDTAATLTTWIYCAFWQMWAAEQLGYDVYINWPDSYKPGRCLVDLIDKEKFAQVQNMFSWYFKQPQRERPAVRKFCEVWTWETDGAKMKGHSLMAQPLSVIKEYYKKHLHFSDAVEERGNRLVNRYNLDFKNTIGITWRGTDNVTDGRIRLPIEAYFPFIDDILKDNPGMTILATAEEESILDPIFVRYENVIAIDAFYSSPLGHKQNPERFSPMTGFERGMQPALMVWLFSKCAQYIKNRSSTGAVASWLSSGRIVNLAHEETLSYHKMDDQVEIEGIKYPLYR